MDQVPSTRKMSSGVVLLLRLHVVKLLPMIEVYFQVSPDYDDPHTEADTISIVS